MALSAIQSVSFKGNECKNCQKKTGGAVPLIASMSVPGLGQYIDNRGKAGKKYFFTHLGTIVAGGLGGLVTGLSIRKDMLSESAGILTKAGIFGGAAVAVAAGVAGIVNYYKNLKDAYQGDRNIDTQA